MEDAFTRDQLDEMAQQQVAQAQGGERWARAGCKGTLRLVTWEIARDIHDDSVYLEVLISCDEPDARTRAEHTLAEVVHLWP